MSDFSAESTDGPLKLYEYQGSDWLLLFSHPKDFTPVCTTELACLANLHGEFKKRNVKILGLSVDKLEDHQLWKKDVAHYAKCEVHYPLVADYDGSISKKLGMLDDTATDTMTVRGVFVMSPDHRIRASICYPSSTGRNFDEILRLIDSLQLTNERPLTVTPVNWRVGDDVIVKPGAEASGDVKTVDLPSGKDYLRFTK